MTAESYKLYDVFLTDTSIRHEVTTHSYEEKLSSRTWITKSNNHSDFYRSLVYLYIIYK